MLTYAVGDIHGCLPLLDRLLAAIDAHAGGRPRRLVFIGDYVDRGPDSSGTIARLRELQAVPGAEVVCLKGNHEDLLLQARTRPEALHVWLQNGGRATLGSYRATKADGLPPDDVQWIEGLPTSYDDGRRYFVHAGLNPDLPLADQTDADRLWIRDAFLGSDRDFGRFVVHGHTPRRDGRPDQRSTRVNIDTGAVYGGRLTAAIFEDGGDAPTGFLSVPE